MQNTHSMKASAFGKPRPVYTRTGLPAFDESREREFFVYNSPINDFLNGETRKVQIEVQGDTDFELIKLSGMALVYSIAPAALSALLVGYFPIQIFNITNSEQLFLDVDFGSIFSSASYPFVLPDPHPISARSIVEITITNTIGVDIFFFNIAFIGAKVFQ